jgi:ribosomal protein L7Ae-like RNA K-turn-binding protein
MSGVLGLLGLGLRGGNLAVGVEAVRKELQRSRLGCVVVASDASRRALDKVVRLAEGRRVPLIRGPRADDLGAQLGRPPVMAVGVRDRGLAQGVLRAASTEE